MDHKRLFTGIGGGAFVVLIIVAVVLIHREYFFTDQRRSSDGLTGGIAPKNGVMPYLTQERDGTFKSAAPDRTFVLSDKKIIKNGYLGLVVETIDATAKAIAAFVENKEGFVESLEQGADKDGIKHATLTIRVPVSVFSGVMETIKAKAVLVEIERVSGQDVTEQYIDLEARLKNLRATEQQYLEILKRALTVEDTLKVAERLAQVRGQIESLEGQIKYLTNQTDLATITVALSEEPTVGVSIKDFRPRTVLKAAASALISVLVVSFNVLVRFVIVWIPMLAIIGAIAYGLWRALQRFNALRKK